MKKVSAETRMYIKRRVISLRQEGWKNSQISKVLNVPAPTVANIVCAYNHKGDVIFQEKVRGRKVGEKRVLSPKQEEEIQAIIKTHTPEEEGIASCLWGRPAIQQLIKQRFDINVSIRVITDYLKRWKMTCQRPALRNYKQDKEKVKEFKTKTYPEILRKAEEENTDIVFIDETGINNQEYRVRGFSPRGCTPVVNSVSHRESINMISAIGPNGTCRYMCYDEAMTQRRFIQFMGLITRAKTGRKILAITDNLRVHHGLLVQEWLKDRTDRIELHFIPAYSPELNADEYLNHVLKQNVHSGILPRTKDDLKKRLTPLCKT